MNNDNNNAAPANDITAAATTETTETETLTAAQKKTLLEAIVVAESKLRAVVNSLAWDANLISAERAAELEADAAALRGRADALWSAARAGGCCVQAIEAAVEESIPCATETETETAAAEHTIRKLEAGRYELLGHIVGRVNYGSGWYIQHPAESGRGDCACPKSGLFRVGRRHNADTLSDARSYIAHHHDGAEAAEAEGHESREPIHLPDPRTWGAGQTVYTCGDCGAAYEEDELSVRLEDGVCQEIYGPDGSVAELAPYVQCRECGLAAEGETNEHDGTQRQEDTSASPAAEAEAKLAEAHKAIRLILCIDDMRAAGNGHRNPETVVLGPASRQQLIDALGGDYEADGGAVDVDENDEDAPGHVVGACFCCSGTGKAIDAAVFGYSVNCRACAGLGVVRRAVEVAR